ncbi:MAG: outer membrane beta-barrel protein [Bacteroidaceae bacterium]|nr:outer membrane beta-barrel protein [Bacteroidaceae bacterium]
MKKFVVTLLFAVVTLGASAQFEKGTHYGEASITGLGIGYEKNTFSFGFGAGYGYFVADNWMVGGRLGYRHQGAGNNFAAIQALFRYSFKKNGLNLGAGLQYEHAGGDYVQLCPQVGYTFYLNHYVSLEPAIYCDLGLNEIKYGTNFGLKIGIGLYYNKKK